MNVEERVRDLGESAPRRGITKATGWYQCMDLDGIITAKNIRSSEFSWSIIAKLFDGFDGISFLDAGCNAGLYCLEVAKLGASVVVGVDKEESWINQALFAKEVYEKRDGVEYNIEFVCEDLLSLDKSIGDFNYSLVAGGVSRELLISHGVARGSERSVLAQWKLSEILADISDNVIVQVVEGSQASLGFQDVMFGSFGMRRTLFVESHYGAFARYSWMRARRRRRK